MSDSSPSWGPASIPLDLQRLRGSKFGDGQAAFNVMCKASDFSSLIFWLKFCLLLSRMGKFWDFILKWFCDEEWRLVAFCTYNLRPMVWQGEKHPPGFPTRPLLCCMDSRVGLQVLQQLQPSNNVGLVAAIQASLQSLTVQGWQVRLKWIPRNVGMQGKEATEAAARQAAEGSHVNRHVPLSQPASQPEASEGTGQMCHLSARPPTSPAARGEEEAGCLAQLCYWLPAAWRLPVAALGRRLAAAAHEAGMPHQGWTVWWFPGTGVWLLWQTQLPTTPALPAVLLCYCRPQTSTASTRPASKWQLAHPLQELPSSFTTHPQQAGASGRTSARTGSTPFQLTFVREHCPLDQVTTSVWIDRGSHFISISHKEQSEQLFMHLIDPLLYYTSKVCIMYTEGEW